MTAELHPKLSIKIVFLKSWWLLVLMGIFLNVTMVDTGEPPLTFSWRSIHLIFSINSLLVLCSGAICLIALVAIYLDLSAYLLIENGILERRWSWLKSGSSNRVKLCDMQKCTIQRNALSVGRGIRDFYGFVFDPKKPDPFWEELRIDMPVGVATSDQENFLMAIRAEMKKSR